MFTWRSWPTSGTCSSRDAQFVCPELPRQHIFRNEAARMCDCLRQGRVTDKPVTFIFMSGPFDTRGVPVMHLKVQTMMSGPGLHISKLYAVFLKIFFASAH